MVRSTVAVMVQCDQCTIVLAAQTSLCISPWSSSTWSRTKKIPTWSTLHRQSSCISCLLRDFMGHLGPYPASTSSLNFFQLGNWWSFFFSGLGYNYGVHMVLLMPTCHTVTVSQSTPNLNLGASSWKRESRHGKHHYTNASHSRHSISLCFITPCHNERSKLVL